MPLCLLIFLTSILGKLHQHQSKGWCTLKCDVTSSGSNFRSVITFWHVIYILGTVELTHKAPNTTIAEFANTVDPDETPHNEPSHLDLQCLPSSF